MIFFGVIAMLFFFLSWAVIGDCWEKEENSAGGWAMFYISGLIAMLFAVPQGKIIIGVFMAVPTIVFLGIGIWILCGWIQKAFSWIFSHPIEFIGMLAMLYITLTIYNHYG